MISLCYHDVLATDDPDSSGFPGASAATYKLSAAAFASHVAAVASVLQAKPQVQVRFTFDDGGAGSSLAADILERAGLRGFFFIPTNYIGRKAFATAAELADLHRRGHIVGGHSCSHQGRMASKPDQWLAQEWNGCVAALSDVIGARVTTGSVPSGYYSRRVASAASKAEIRLLFTLEPTTAPSVVEQCQVAGRYTIRSFHTAGYAARIAAGELLPRLRQRMSWNVRQVLKSAPGYSGLRRVYFDTRRRILSS